MGSSGVFASCAIVVGTLWAPATVVATMWPYGGGAPEAPPAAVVPGDTASLALKVYGNNPNANLFVNALGDTPVRRGSSFTNIGGGAPGYGNYTVQASWDEIIGVNNNTVRVIWKTSNAQAFVPFGSTVGGQPVGYVEWRVGVTNPVSFLPSVAHVDLTAAFIGVSTNGGASINVHDITAGVSNPWNGTSFGTTLPFNNFINANYIEALFIYVPVPVPAPATFAAVVMGVGLCAARRRRSRSGC